MEEDDQNSIVQSWSTPLLLLSFAMSYIGAYMTTSLAEQYRVVMELKPKIFGGYLLLVLMAISIGGVAIWCMHFIGMGALELRTKGGVRIEVTYDVTLTVLSLLSSLIFSMAGIWLSTRDRYYSVSRRTYVEMISEDVRGLNIRALQNPILLWVTVLFKRLWFLIAGGIVTGAGVCVMHYIGMMAMTCDAKVTWVPGIVAASVIIAIVASTAGFWIIFRLLSLFPDKELLRIVCSIIIAVAVCGMHYTGMAAARYSYDPSEHHLGHSNVSQINAVFMCLTAGVIFVLLLVTFLFIELRSWFVNLLSIIEESDAIMADVKRHPVFGHENFVRLYEELRLRLPGNTNKKKFSTFRTSQVASIQCIRESDYLPKLSHHTEGGGATTQEVKASSPRKQNNVFANLELIDANENV